MEKWARWRDPHNRWIKYDLGYGQCMSGRLLDGMKRIKCTAAGCVKGETEIKLNGQKFYLPCTQCMGSGYISAKSTETKINPKLIHGTGGRYPDEQSDCIDRLVSKLPRINKKVVLQEYDWLGTQEIKARRVRSSYENYKKILQRSHEFIEKGLTSCHESAKLG